MWGWDSEIADEAELSLRSKWKWGQVPPIFARDRLERKADEIPESRGSATVSDPVFEARPCLSAYRMGEAKRLPGCVRGPLRTRTRAVTINLLLGARYSTGGAQLNKLQIHIQYRKNNHKFYSIFNNTTYC